MAVYARVPERPRRAVVRLFTPGHRVGVLGVVTRPDGRLLLVDQPYVEGWSLPGGDLKRGETVAQALGRELREEIGLHVQVPEPVLAAHRPHDRWVTFIARVPVDDGVADTLAARSPELSSTAWSAPTALPPLHEDVVGPLRVAGVLPPL